MTERPATRGGYPSTTRPVTEFPPPTAGATSEASADELRAAARRLRETAAGATRGRWADASTDPDGMSPVWIAAWTDSLSWPDESVIEIRRDELTALVAVGEVDGPDEVISPGDRAWIVLAQPSIAEPLAAWLEELAEHWDAVRIAGACKPSDRALAVARAITGGDRG